MPIPAIRFTDEHLPNGLRYIIAEDHLTPVVAVNIWYAVGSKNEVPGKTGFAHLFEHVMFQGSAHVGKAEHIALVQAAGGTMNGTTWLDRTNYYGQQVEMDGQGRLLLPQLLRESGQIKGEVAVLGNLTFMVVRNLELFKREIQEEKFTPEDEKTLDELGI